MQEVPEALQQLPYFYEDVSDIPGIAAGSMLASWFDPQISFPVGQVEWLVIQPASCPEFLGAIGETASLEQVLTIPAAAYPIASSAACLRLLHTIQVIKIWQHLLPFMNRCSFHTSVTWRNMLMADPRLITSGMRSVKVLPKRVSGSSS